MTTEAQQLQAGIAALEAQRALLGDAVVDSALGPMRARLDALRPADDPPPAAAQTLKQVSIVFMDVVGSTRMSQRLDPEDTSALMDGTLARAAAVVQAHRGRVLQYAGDSLLAAFGADHAAEDDAERAVRCGLALCRLGRTVGAELRGAHGDDGGDAPFAVRVGVHTGEVLLGGGVSEGGTIRGINVSIAARLEQTAPAGAVRISHDTHALVRGVFDVDAQPPLPVKGVDAPLRSYLVRGEKPSLARGPARGIEGVATPMIGRDDELAALQGAFRRLASEPALAAVSVVGDAGIGKSRLVDEFVRWAEAQSDPAIVLRGRTTPQTPGRPFGLLGDLVTRHLQIADDDTMAVARDKVERGIAPLFAGDDPAVGAAHAHLLGHLLGIELPASSHLQGILQDPGQIRNRAFRAAALVVRRTAERATGPLIVLVEDLHWADDESLDFLTYLLDADRDVPVLVLAAMRPTLLERRPDWLAMGSRHRRVDLAPLDRHASRELTQALMKKLPEVPAALRDHVSDAAEGNPFYIEELVQMLIDQGVIATTGATWSLQAMRLPATLTGVLQARLDGLPAAERLALQQASVIGPVFWDRALAALDAQAAAALPELVRRELVLPRSASAVDGFAEYAFKHHLLHQVAYGTVLKRARRELHGRLATWLTAQAEHGGVRAGDVLALIAHHFEAAADDARAAEFHARAAEHAAERFAHAAVLLHAERALALLDGLAERGGGTFDHATVRWRVLLAREKTHSLQGRRAEQRLDLQALDAITQASIDDRRRAEVALRCGLLARIDADWPASERHARDAMRWAGAAGDDAGRLQAQVSLALALRGRGQLDDASALARSGLAEASERGLKRIAWGYFRALALITESQGDEVESAEMERQALRIARELGDRIGEAIGLDCMGQCAILVGDLAEAERSFEAALRLQRELGLRSHEAHALAYLAAVLLWRGDEARALVVAGQALEVAVASGARYAEAWAKYRLGEAQSALGRNAEASASFAAAAALARDIGIDLERTALAGLARAAMAQGDLATALGHVETVMAGAQPDVAAPDTTFHPELVALTCHDVLARVGDARAAMWLERARAILWAVANRIPDAAQRQAHVAAMPHRRAIAARCSTAV